MENIIKEAETKLNNSIKSLNEKLSSIIATGASPLMLKNIEVKYYDSLTPLSQIANIKAPDSSMLLVIPFDRSSLKDIIEAINKMNIGLNPIQDGETIKITVPPMTTDKRETFAKEAKSIGELSKISIRNIRTESNKKIKLGGFSENEERLSEEKIQKLIDVKNKEIEEIIKLKIKNLLSL